MINNAITFLSEYYDYYTNFSQTEKLESKENITCSQSANAKKWAIDSNPEYLGILEPFNARHIVKKLGQSNHLTPGSCSTVDMVVQNTLPTEKLKLQYNMVQKKSLWYNHSLIQEAHNNENSNKWVKYSYLDPYTLTMKNTGNDLYSCMTIWKKELDIFLEEQRNKLENNTITCLEYKEAFYKYLQSHIDTVRIIFKQILEELIALSAKNICYFDIKPGNITIDNRGVASLIDFDCKIIDSRDTALEHQRFSILPISLPFCPPDNIKYPNIGFTYKVASWSLGLNLLYVLDPEAEYLPPLRNNDEDGFNDKLYGDYICYIQEEPVCLDEQSKDLIIKLLDLNPVTRLSLQEAKDHPFFSNEFCLRGAGLLLKRQELFDNLCEYENQLRKENNKKHQVINPKLIEDIKYIKQEIDVLDAMIAERSSAT